MIDKRILVVDDDDAIRALLFTILRRRGFKVDSARTGLEAMERCARCHYAVMLLDLMMPHMNGFDVLDAMERVPCEQRPIIIVLTAGTEPRNLAPDLVAGTIRKPFDIELLVDTIAGCISMLGGIEQGDGCPTADSDIAGRERDLSRPAN
jgi:CheY-like chemotaxis protein